MDVACPLDGVAFSHVTIGHPEIRDHDYEPPVAAGSPFKSGRGPFRPHNHTLDKKHWQDCPGCDDGTWQ